MGLSQSIRVRLKDKKDPFGSIPKFLEKSYDLDSSPDYSGLYHMLGARKSGVAMGFAGGVGLFILVFVFGLKPASPPVNVLLIIIAVSSMAATLQVAGGLDLLVHLAEKVLRSRPDRITFMAPIVTFLFTVFTGTSYVALAVYPVICEVALEAKIRVERPMSIALVASQHGISASPVSASTAALLAVLAAHGVSLGQIMMVLFPAIFLGIIVGALSVYKKGLELEKFLKLVKNGDITFGSGESKNYKPTKEAVLSVTLFALGVFFIVLLGSVKALMPSWNVGGKVSYLSIPNAIEIIAFLTSFIMVFTCKLQPGKIAKSSVFSAGMTGVIAIFGIAWMTDTFFLAHKAFVIDSLGGIVREYPILFAVMIFVMSALLLSQGATTRSIMPIGVSLGLPLGSLVAFAPAVNGLFFFPATGSAISAITFDRSGTTKIGRYVLNHSFQLPGFVTCISSILFGLVISYFVF